MENAPGATFGSALPLLFAQMGPCATTGTSSSSPSFSLSEVYSATTSLQSVGTGWLKFSDDLDIQLDIGSSTFAPYGAGWAVPFTSNTGAGKVKAGEAINPILRRCRENYFSPTASPITGLVILPMTNVASLWDCVSDDGHFLPAGAPVYYGWFPDYACVVQH